MSKIEKLFEKLKKKPTPSDILFKEVNKLLRAYGFLQRQPSGGGSHYIYTHLELPNYNLSIPKHRGKLKAAYVIKTVNAIEKVKELLEDNENENTIR